jgi:DNA-binding response OmpR family regulator
MQMVWDRNGDVSAISTGRHYVGRGEVSRVSRDAQSTSKMIGSTGRQSVLIVEDDPGCRALLQAIFVSNGFRVTSTDSVLGASELVERLRPNVIVLDLALPYRSGASWLVDLKSDRETANIPVVILSAHPTVLTESRRKLAHAIIGKPFQTQSLMAAIRTACDGDPGPEAIATGG